MSKMNQFTLLLVTCLVFRLVKSNYLIYTNGGAFKYLIGWSFPLEIPRSVAFAYNLQFQYPPIDNATKLSDLYEAGLVRKTRSFHQNYFYQGLEKALEHHGHSSSGCLLKFICEIGETPLGPNGLFGEVIDFIFTPEQEDGVYWDAWSAGASGEDCSTLYDCPEQKGLLDQFVETVT